MISVPQVSTYAGNFSAATAHATIRQTLDELRTGDGQTLEANHVQKITLEDSLRSGLSSSSSPVNGETFAARLDAARQEAEKSAQEGNRPLANRPAISGNPLDALLKSELRRARSAHQVAARYLIAVQGDSSSLAARFSSAGSWRA
ncbi:MAG: hypothetical protein HQL95_04215 [Magnetococcales bacterium]|nr:hypothetical protein [Magnetococcales bacterium]